VLCIGTKKDCTVKSYQHDAVWVVLIFLLNVYASTDHINRTIVPMIRLVLSVPATDQSIV